MRKSVEKLREGNPSHRGSRCRDTSKDGLSELFRVVLKRVISSDGGEGGEEEGFQKARRTRRSAWPHFADFPSVITPLLLFVKATERLSPTEEELRVRQHAILRATVHQHLVS